jgi:enoyl-CoA hydratase/carnithine racemase
MMEFVDLTVDGPVALVRLDRPPVNALAEDVAVELTQAFGQCADPEIRAVVVTGEPHFAAGADIKGFQATFDAGGNERSAWTLQEAINTLEGLEKPTIAAVHGYALGGGLELAMGADFRYLAEDAQVGQPEILLGLIPGAGGTQRLARIVGYQRAKELILTGRQVSADEALAIGLADKVLPAEDLLQAALRDAREWAARPTRAVAAAKRALNAGFGLPVSEGLLIERDAFNETFATEDAREGVAAFIAKRPAEFKGR